MLVIIDSVLAKSTVLDQKFISTYEVRLFSLLSITINFIYICIRKTTAWANYTEGLKTKISSMQMSLPMIELALPVTVSKAELRQLLNISNHTLKKRYLHEAFYEECGVDYATEKLKNDLSIELTNHFFKKYPEMKRLFVLKFLSNPELSKNLLELMAASSRVL